VRRLDGALVGSDLSLLVRCLSGLKWRQAAAGQSGVKPPHSKELDSN
jgi:hypothetical protein